MRVTLDGAAMRAAWMPLPRARLAVVRARWALSLWPAALVAIGAAAAVLEPVAAVVGVLLLFGVVAASIVWSAPARALRTSRWALWSWPWLAGALGLGLRVRVGDRDRLLVPLLLRSTPWWSGGVSGVDLVVRLLPGQRAEDVERFAEGLRLRWAAHVEAHRSGRVFCVRVVLDDDGVLA